MRVTPSPLDERGAVVVMVAILLVVLIGMVVLVIDVGTLLVLKGRMGTAADSASLAAAQSCAMEQGEGAAQAEANDVALGNLGGVSGVGSDSFVSFPSCDDASGSISVSYSGEQSMYFAPVLGFDSVTTVGSTASAMWGPSTVAEPIPIVLSNPEGSGGGCESSCSYWYDADPDDATPTAPTFGFVHLSAWRARGGAPGSCPARASALTRWIRATQVVEVPLREPPALACAVRGSGDWQTAILEQVDSRAFVINDRTQMIGGHYAAVGFTPLVIHGLSQGVGEARVECARIDRDLETDAVIDLTLQVLSCLLTQGLSSVEIEVLPDGLDYEFNPLTNTFRWLDEATDNVTIVIWGEQEADGGECGEPVPTEDGEESWCLTVAYEGPKLGGSEPNGAAADFGLRAIRLTGDQ